MTPLNASGLMTRKGITLSAFGLLLLSGLLILCLSDGIHEDAYNIALDYFEQNKPMFKYKECFAIIDYTKPSFTKRFYIFNTNNGQVSKHLVAHGKETGGIYASEFSNEQSSYKSCRGFFITGEIFFGKHGKSLRLEGLESGINDNALVRGIVIHAAPYVSWKAIVINLGRLGRSWGCPAVSENDIDEIVGMLGDGALVYIHANQ